VEAHRLRKRLKEYYDGAGSSHTIHIEIPSGQYVPRFQIRPDLPSVDLPAVAVQVPNGDTAPVFTEVEVLPPLAPVVRRHGHSRMLASAAALLLIAVGIVFYRYRTKPVPMPADQAAAAAGDKIAANPLSTEEAGALRILAGRSGAPYTDRFGGLWISDTYFTGGSAVADTHSILGTPDVGMFRSHREGTFHYDIPLRPGVYEMHLYFAETKFVDPVGTLGSDDMRVFNVLANGRTILGGFDLAADAGPNTADVRVFKDIRPGAHGILHLSFEPSKYPAVLSAIEILPGVPGKIRPVRMVSRATNYTDSEGRLWEADHYVFGGHLTFRNDLISGAVDPEIYRGERYGNIKYVIPVAPGRYTAIFHFAETWFGPGKFGRGGNGNRVFDILYNGIALDKNLDIFEESGGSDRALVKTFHGLEPNAQGKLILSLVPTENYACINALEIIDESR
ncbi:MAG: malectin domain-containing carbohydrate-binding protein, partial [Bryobacteraceae bacterium]